MKYLILVLLSFGVLLADFSRSSNGIVTDSSTGLMWQDDYSDNGDNIKAASWSNAINYCEALTLGGYKNWRLPNIKELNTIVDRTKLSSPYIYSVFTNTASSDYWSSSTNVSYTSSAWNVYFSYGYTHNYNKSSSFYVRCTRDRQ